MVPASAALWAFWVLPSIDESGTPGQLLSWFFVQLLMPVSLSLLIYFLNKIGYIAVLCYGVFIGLHGFGDLGWALMGTFTPFLVYLHSILMIVIGLACLYFSMKDLGIGKNSPRILLEN